MKWSRLNVENAGKNTVDIKRNYEIVEGITIKANKHFIKALESVAVHIMNNKKIYKRFVVYLAFTMFLYTIPEIIGIIEETGFQELIQYINNTPKYIIANHIAKFLSVISYYVLIVLTFKDICSKTFKSIISNMDKRA